VFLDSAGSSLMSASTLAAVQQHLELEARIGGYAAADQVATRLSELRSSVARLVGSDDPEEIALSDSGTRAWTSCFYSIPLAPGQTILLTGPEYASNAIAALQRAEQAGAQVSFVAQNPDGGIDLDDLEAKLHTADVAAISLVQVPTNGGLVGDVRTAAALAHQAGAFVLLDGCQSVGQLAVDVNDLDIDALACTGRKWLRGPRGTGMLWVRRRSLERLRPAMLDLRSASWTGPTTYEVAESARRFEFWEQDVAALVGLAAALDEALDYGIERIEQAVRRRARYLRTQLASLGRVNVHDPDDGSGIVSFTVEGLDPVTVQQRLREQRVTTTVSRRPSTLVDMTRRNLLAVGRASPHYFVSDSDLDRAVSVLAAL